MSIEQWSDLLFSEAEKQDRHIVRKVMAINADGSYMVQLNASGTLTRCAPFCTANVGDRVEVVIKANGKCDAIGRLGGEVGGGSGGGSSTGFFTLEVDEDGNLYAIYEDGSTPPTFSLDENGDLYYIIRE